MENCEYTIQAKAGAISIDQLKKMLLARFGMRDIEITVHRPLNPYDFPDREVPGLAEACKDAIAHWEGFYNTSGVMDVCDTDNERELAVKVYAVFRDEMSMGEAVKCTKELIVTGCNNAAAYAVDAEYPAQCEESLTVPCIQFPKGAGKTPGISGDGAQATDQDEVDGK